MLNAQYRKKIGLVLLVTLILRMIAMWLIPLTDTTEARYGEIARKMLETGNWVTPQFEYGIPFWAKPPLSTWLSSISMGMFGVNEFAARLPSLLLCLGILYLIYQWLKFREGNVKELSVVVLSTSILFCGSAGLVMTDLCLIFSSTLAMTCFWEAVVENKGKKWGYLFFISLGIGLLAKGPLILVLVGLPTGVWTLLNFQLKNVWTRLPWITGLVLTIAIAGPWYWLAEKRTPGFLEYFIIGEHFNRFLVSGWTGDRYGHAHSEPLGMIWLYLFLGFLPWFGLIISLLFKHIFKNRRELKITYLLKDSWVSYLVLWSVMPIVFFTFAHNIISPYVLPAMPACAILFAEYISRFNVKNNEFNQKPIFWLSLVMPAIMVLLIVIYYVFPAFATKRSEKDLMHLYMDLRKDEASKIMYVKDRLYSAEFYSAGKSKIAMSTAELQPLLTNDTNDFVAADANYINGDLKEFLDKNFKSVGSFHNIFLFKECENADGQGCQH